jgi:hypothetical protein
VPAHYPERHAKYSDYTLCTDVTETAVQEPMLTESYGNFGLARRKELPPSCPSRAGRVLPGLVLCRCLALRLRQ